MKPIKYSITEYYIIPVLKGVRAAYRKLTGKWYCYECEKYHGRRIKKYKEVDEIYHCSLWWR